ncbi:MAG: FAD-dependent oxidoreductase [Rhodoplanes sp.]|uniref:hydroxysqualene dehydroxylase HpnE n=1 Tax=Rhodoplanes sp. TaxID=1968906 RepID=UPI0018398B95|nr:hydroxysqualene dehydroxylase HpnE [Rhodoplanes sp.]NVO14685.1 FAD-dependent oxidoreductase [Rhodoplanes sp.]
MTGTVHIIGAGLAGLAAAVRLSGAGRTVAVHEGTAYAGGRCRSYHDHATGLLIDNGNHLLLSGNRAAHDYARAIGTEHRLTGPDAAEFAFHDLRSRKGWRIRISDGRIPWWIFDPAWRVPDTTWRDYLGLAKILVASDRPLGEVIACTGTLYDRLIEPLMVAALNTSPPESSALLARNIVRETLAVGGEACRPRIARDGLGTVFVEPAVAMLRDRGVAVRLDHELRALVLEGERVVALDFGGDRIDLSADDAVILAVPAWAATALVPGVSGPTAFRSILNTHFRAVAPAGTPALTGVLGGTTEWIFVFPDRVSVTTSNADRFMKEPREKLAETIWGEVCAVTGLTGEMPPWQIVRERRATFAATPEQNARRPGPSTAWKNLVLAGDWTATGLPSTIEGAIRSGNAAAALM